MNLEKHPLAGKQAVTFFSENIQTEVKLVATASNMLPLGTKAPDYSLPDTVSGKQVSLSEIGSNKANVIFFICNHCPFVKHILKVLVQVAYEYKQKGIAFVAISSNDVVNYPDDAPDKMKELAVEMDFSFPYLYDETQETARAYQAACTPDFFVFDNDLKCVYRGQFDDARPGNDIPVTGQDLRNALDRMLSGSLPDNRQKPSMGCNIKWK